MMRNVRVAFARGFARPRLGTSPFGSEVDVGLGDFDGFLSVSEDMRKDIRGDPVGSSPLARARIRVKNK